jgi:hypothetical protein
MTARQEDDSVTAVAPVLASPRWRVDAHRSDATHRIARLADQAPITTDGLILLATARLRRPGDLARYHCAAARA